MIYEPGEDTELLLKHIPKLAHGSVLDVGCGSGVLAAKDSETAEKVVGVDVNPEAVKYCKEKYPNIEFRISDLFENVEGYYDLIIFNPPYLPKDEWEPDECAQSTCGGEQGYELLTKFLEEAVQRLNDKGVILTVFSSLTQPKLVFDKAEELGYDFEVLETQKLAFEKIYCVMFKLNK